MQRKLKTSSLQNYTCTYDTDFVGICLEEKLWFGDKDKYLCTLISRGTLVSMELTRKQTWCRHCTAEHQLLSCCYQRCREAAVSAPNKHTHTHTHTQHMHTHTHNIIQTHTTYAHTHTQCTLYLWVMTKATRSPHDRAVYTCIILYMYMCVHMQPVVGC